MSLKVGVIGVGGIARSHMPGWAASEDAEVVAGGDISEAALQAWGAQYNVGRLETDVAALIDRFAWGRSSAVACCEQCGEMQAGERVLTARRCSWSDSPQSCWLDAHDVALRCEAAGQSFRLTQYSRRHD